MTDAVRTRHAGTYLPQDIGVLSRTPDAFINRTTCATLMIYYTSSGPEQPVELWKISRVDVCFDKCVQGRYVTFRASDRLAPASKTNIVFRLRFLFGTYYNINHTAAAAHGHLLRISITRPRWRARILDTRRHVIQRYASYPPPLPFLKFKDVYDRLMGRKPIS